MSGYSISLFLHIVGALGLFVSIGLEQVSVARLRRATTTSQAREWLAVLGGLRRVDGPSGFFILATGFYMVVVRSGHDAWIGLGLLGMVLMAILSIAITSRRARALTRALDAGDGPMSTSLHARLADPMLRSAASMRAAIGLGIVFNMAAKPIAPLAVAAFGVSLLLGAAVALLRGSARSAVVSVGQRDAAA